MSIRECDIGVHLAIQILLLDAIDSEHHLQNNEYEVSEMIFHNLLFFSFIAHIERFYCKCILSTRNNRSIITSLKVIKNDVCL